MSERTALKHGQAKVQYYACREKVYQLQDAGYSIQAIYDLLVKDGIITMSYKALHRNISKDRMISKKEPKMTRHLPASNTRQGKPKNSGTTPPEENARQSTGQNLEWSLDKKLEALNLDAAQSGKRKNASSVELEDFDSEEVL